MTGTLILVVSVTLVVSALCSLLEATLYSTRVAIPEAAKAEGHHVAAVSVSKLFDVVASAVFEGSVSGKRFGFCRAGAGNGRRATRSAAV